MMVAFSDVHLCDETVSSNVHASVFDLMEMEITTAARPERKGAQSIEFVLLGDVFDFYRTDYWHQQRVPAEKRPWNGRLHTWTAMNSLAGEVESQFRTIWKRIASTEACQRLISFFRRVGVETGLKPKITYVVGNHDRPFSVFPSLQAELRSQLGGVDLDFASFYRSREYRVLARHGHEWDSNNYGWELLRKVLRPGTEVSRFASGVNSVQCIGDVITAELVSGTIYRLKSELSSGSSRDRSFLRSVSELNNVRPFSAVFDWLSTFSINRPAWAKKYVDLLRIALRDSLVSVLDSQLARYWDRLRLDLVLYEDLTDHLRMAHSVLGRKNGLRLLSGLRPLVSVFTSAVDLKGEAARMDLCGRGAFEELARERGRRGGVRFVFYGHTHEARQDCFDTLPSGDARLYVNTGTFLPFVERARRSDSFWSAYRLGFAFVYGEGEDKRGRDGKGPTLDIWNGIRCKRYVV